MQDLVQRVQVARPVIEYVARILTATREQPEIALGVSPRGGVLLQRAAQACAALDGRSFVTPDDVKAVAEAVHRTSPDPGPVVGSRPIAPGGHSGCTGDNVGPALRPIVGAG